jgi:pilus assembly protein Flp/PilA
MCCGSERGAAEAACGEESMIKRLTKLMNDSRGATAIEYGLIAALIAVAAITAMKGIGSKLNSTFTSVSNDLQ